MVLAIPRLPIPPSPDPTVRPVASTLVERSGSNKLAVTTLGPPVRWRAFLFLPQSESGPWAFSKINDKMSSNGHSSAAIKLPLYPRVLEAMLPFFTSCFGNAASNSHSFGWEAAAAVEKARRQIAALIGASAQEIVFTSGATESDNLALKGVMEACREKGNHVITAVSEHKAVLDSCKHLEKS